RHAHWRGQEADEDVHAQMQVAPGDDGGAEERHRDHDEDLHLVGPEQREAEEITADYVGEVEQNREDEGERQRHFDDARDAVERLVDHRLPALHDIMPRLDRRDTNAETNLMRATGGGQRRYRSARSSAARVSISSTSASVIAPPVALALRCARDTKAGVHVTKNDLTHVTRIFQKSVFTKAAHDARVGDRRGLFCRLGAA